MLDAGLNGTSTSSYIQWCYNLLVKLRNAQDAEYENEFRSLLKSRLVICPLHYLKVFIRQVKMETENPRLRNLYVFAMLLLQDCDSIDTFDFILEELVNIFLSPIYNHAVYISYKVITLSEFLFPPLVSNSLILYCNRH